MPWLRGGTVAVTNGSTTVTGTNADFAANSRVGDAFIGPDGFNYEVANVASPTVISIIPAYKGATVSGSAYAIMPVNGYPKLLADSFNNLNNQFGAKLAALGTTGNYDILPINKGGTGADNFSTALSNLNGQPKTASLSALSFQNFSANQLPYFSSTSAAALTTLSAFGRSLIDDADAASARGTMGLGSAAVAPLVGTVSQSNGLPAGAIIETATSTTGTYTKWADGTMLCTRRLSGQRLLNKAAGALFFDAKEGEPQYPAAFSSEPRVSIQVTGYTYEVLWLGSRWTAPLSAWPAGFVMTEVSRTQSDLVYFDYTAIGRWFG
ncbi:hypothetical protein [Pseudomonas sp. Irchel 3A5]|uniref:hypothetical protein n=1 Tax=Pseudomonas sp. Irchel 3A5 TaxID=2008911 RepID=UPI001595E14A|nr:hypothetical protein [Pseudomonas sp. Irchel 3A5]